MGKAKNNEYIDLADLLCKMTNYKTKGLNSKEVSDPIPKTRDYGAHEVDMAEIDKGLPNAPHERIGNKGAAQTPACHVLEADATTYQLWPRTPILCLSRGLRTEPKSMP